MVRSHYAIEFRPRLVRYSPRGQGSRPVVLHKSYSLVAANGRTVSLFRRSGIILRVWRPEIGVFVAGAVLTRC
jgi:hypothetical protein